MTLNNKLASVVSALTIFGIVYAGYSTLATKDDLNRIVKISEFKWAESNIKINELQLDNLDTIKSIRPLTNNEERDYRYISSSTERLIELQRVLLNAQTTTN